jgi:membrane-associated phospholipid phosphatase
MKFIFFLLIQMYLCANLMAQNFDIEVLKTTNLNRNHNLDATFHLFSDADLPIVVATPIILTSIGLLKKDSTLTRKGIYVFATLASTFMLTTALKYAVDRPRPYITYTFLDNQSTESDASFPSGHTSSSFALATSLSLSYPKWYVIAPAYTWASFTAYSRLHLGTTLLMYLQEQ